MGRMKTYITLKDIKTLLESNIELFEMDFKDKKYGERAKLLHKHYKSILALLNAMKKK